MTITISSWIIPLLLNILAFIVAHIKTPKNDTFGIGSLICNGAALIFSLVVWIIYLIVS